MSKARAIVAGTPLERVDVRQEIERSQSKLLFESSLASLQDLGQGAVLVSRSGNTRLVVKSEAESGHDTSTLFLTRSRNAELGLEKAMLSKVDRTRLLGVVRRATGNPLIRISDLAANLATNPDIIHNTAVLLGCGAMGSRLREEMIKNAAPLLVLVQVGLSYKSKRIKTIGADQALPESLIPIGFEFNASGLPAEDYIENIVFYAELDENLKQRIIAACVLANTIANASNLAGLHLAAESESKLH